MRLRGFETSRRTVPWEPLRSAAAEQRWILERIETGIAQPERALVSYENAAVIYGRRGGDDAARLVRAGEVGCEILRRRTGGGTVLAGHWMAGFHVLLPPQHPVARLGVIGSMVWFGKVACAALRLSRVSVRLADAPDIDQFRRQAAQASLEWACYAGLSHGELLDADGRKLVGLAQCRGRWGILLSGGLLIGESPWEVLEYVHSGSRPARSALHGLVSKGIGIVAPTVSLRDLYGRLATCVDIGLRSEVTTAESLATRKADPRSAGSADAAAEVFPPPMEIAGAETLRNE
jgi:lipoate-protein ligase A